jgi:hypothetical protein
MLYVAIAAGGMNNYHVGAPGLSLFLSYTFCRVAVVFVVAMSYILYHNISRYNLSVYIIIFSQYLS